MPQGTRSDRPSCYDTAKVRQLRGGRPDLDPAEPDHPDQAARDNDVFPGFDRGPYLSSFQSGAFRFPLANVHLFYGPPKKTDIERRIPRDLRGRRWANKRRTDPHSYVPETIPLGDFNLPKAVKGDPIYDALTYRGLEIPAHTSQIGSAIASDSHYDQIAFFPGAANNSFTGQMNVFDFDNALFADLYKDRGLEAVPRVCAVPHLRPPAAVGGVQYPLARPRPSR